MKAEREQLLRDPDIPPTGEVMAQALGEAYTAYLKFVGMLADHGIRLEWRYYRDGRAWLAKGCHRWVGLRGGQKDLTVFWLSVWVGFFKVTLYIPEKARTGVLSLPLDDAALRRVAESKQMGKLKFFPLVFDVCSEEPFEGIFMLADFRKRIR